MRASTDDVCMDRMDELLRKLAARYPWLRETNKEALGAREDNAEGNDSPKAVREEHETGSDPRRAGGAVGDAVGHAASSTGYTSGRS